MRKKGIILLLILSMAISGISCADEKSAQETDDSGFKLEYTDYKLAGDGKTDYKILIDSSADAMTQYGAQEFASFFKQATYADIEIETMKTTYTEEACYISIGDNSYSSSAGLDYEEEDLKSEGYHIETKGRSLFVCGGSGKGDLYGVYDLLGKLFDLDFYSNDETAFVKRYEMNVPKLNYTDNPDFDTRILYTGSVVGDMEYQQRTRTSSWESAWTGVGGAHSTFTLINTTREEHPDWFARKLNEDGSVAEEYKQLCFTNEEVIGRLTEAVLTELEKYPDREQVMVGIEDNRSYCCCPTCTAMMEQYNGCASASVIKCVNRIAAEVKQHLEETQQERNVKVVMFAYYGYLKAPVTQNNDGTYAPIDDSVVLADNAAVMIAPIDSDYAHSYYEDSYNKAEIQAFKQWSTLSKSIDLWTYTTNFSYMLCPYDAFNSLQENYQFWKEYHVKYVYAQGQYGNVKASGFIDLQTYLQSKLLWNVDVDIEELTDKYFDNYFKEASAPMRQYYEELRVHYANLRKESGVTGGIYFDIEKKDYWPYQLLQGWEDCIQRAYEAIEPYRESDPEQYQKLSDRICLESIAIRHMTATLHKGMFNDSEYSAYTKALKEDMSRLKISRYSEGKGIDELPY